jgi:hypothetical protein
MRWKERGLAAAVHLMASLLVAALAAVLVLLVWFPYPYRHVAGGIGLFVLMVGVDVVLGPALTFTVFNRAKPRTELRRDLAIVVLLQLAALGYGLTTAFQARPVYLVHEVDRFRVVRAAELEPSELQKAPQEFRELPWHGVRVIGVRAPRDNKEMLDVVDSALSGRDVSLMPGWWQRIGADNEAEIRARARNLDFVRTRATAADKGGNLERIVAEANVPPEHVIALPLVGRGDDWSVLLDRRDLRIIGYLPVDIF